MGCRRFGLSLTSGATIDANTATRLAALLDEPGVEDLVVMAHGWNNDKNDATKLYGTLWANTCTNFAGGKAERIVVAGVLWPAKAFQTDFDEAALTTAHAGDALAAPSGAAVADLSEQDFESLLSEFNTFMGASGAATIAAARTAAKGLTASASQALVRHGAAAVSIDVESPNTGFGDAAPIARAQVEPTNAQLLLSNLVQPPRLRLTPSVGTVMGLGSAVQGLIAGSRAAVGRFLNLLTYFEMKRRAGIVGVSLAELGARQAHTGPADPPAPRRSQLRREAGDGGRQSISVRRQPGAIFFNYPPRRLFTQCPCPAGQTGPRRRVPIGRRQARGADCHYAHSQRPRLHDRVRAGLAAFA